MYFGELPKLTDDLIQEMKKNNDPSYKPYKCMKLMMECESFIEEAENKGYYEMKEFFDQMIDLYFEIKKYSYPDLLDIKDQMDALDMYIPKKFINSFYHLRFELYVEVMVLIEEEITIDAAVSLGKEVTEENHMEIVEDIEKNLAVPKKVQIYESIICQYMNKKHSSKLVEGLFDDESDIPILRYWIDQKIQNGTFKNVKTNKDRLKLYQTVIRWLFYYYYDEEIEYYKWLELAMSDISFNESFMEKENLANNFMLSIGKLLNNSPLVGENYNEYCFDFIADNLGIKISGGKYKTIRFKSLERFIRKNYDLNGVYQKMIDSIFNNCLLGKKMFDEDKFYCNYPKRFSLEEFKIWDKAVDLLEMKKIEESRSLFKKLNNHKDFFRYKFNILALHFYEDHSILHEMIDSALESEIDIEKEPEMVFNIVLHADKLIKIFNNRKEIVINEYPEDEINHQLQKFELLKSYVELPENVLNEFGEFVAEAGYHDIKKIEIINDIQTVLTNIKYFDLLLEKDEKFVLAMSKLLGDDKDLSKMKINLEDDSDYKSKMFYLKLIESILINGKMVKKQNQGLYILDSSGEDFLSINIILQFLAIIYIFISEVNRFSFYQTQSDIVNKLQENSLIFLDFIHNQYGDWQKLDDFIQKICEMFKEKNVAFSEDELKSLEDNMIQEIYINFFKLFGFFEFKYSEKDSNKITDIKISDVGFIYSEQIYNSVNGNQP